METQNDSVSQQAFPEVNSTKQVDLLAVSNDKPVGFLRNISIIPPIESKIFLKDENGEQIAYIVDDVMLYPDVPQHQASVVLCEVTKL
jgi:hypothetical protein